MYSKLVSKWKSSIPLRLSSLYSGIFALCILGISFLFYLLIAKYLDRMTDEWLSIEAKEFREIMQKEALSVPEIKEAMEKEAFLEGLFLCIRDQNGKNLISSDKEIGKNFWFHRESFWLYRDPFPWKRSQKMFFETIENKGKFFRVAYLPMSSQKILTLVVSIKKNIRFLKLLRRLFLAIYPFMILFFFVVGYFMLKATLQPILTITEVAKQISIENLDERIPVKTKGDELDELAININEMLEKISCLLTALQEKNDTLAHNLRTPVSRIRLEAELTLLRDRPEKDYKTILENCIEECDHMLDMLNTMLDIAEVEARSIALKREKIDLVKLVSEVVEIFSEITREKKISITTQYRSKAPILGSYKQLRQAIINVFDNAIKYSLPEGQISVEILLQEKEVVLKIKDSGIGIPGEDIEHIFKRFYRGKNSRHFSGNGLGLPFVKAVAKALHGKVEIQSTERQGTSFLFKFPVAS